MKLICPSCQKKVDIGSASRYDVFNCKCGRKFRGIWANLAAFDFVVNKFLNPFAIHNYDSASDTPCPYCNSRIRVGDAGRNAPTECWGCGKTLPTSIIKEFANGPIKQAKISAENGTLRVTLEGGATIISGGNGTNTLTLSGTHAQINRAIETISYKSYPEFVGTDTVTIVSDEGTDSITVDVQAPTVPPTTGSISELFKKKDWLGLAHHPAYLASHSAKLTKQKRDLISHFQNNRDKYKDYEYASAIANIEKSISEFESR